MTRVGREILTGIICPQTPMGSYLVNVRYSPSVGGTQLEEGGQTQTHTLREDFFFFFKLDTLWLKLI